MTAERDDEKFAVLVDALGPYLGRVVIVGGWAHRLFRHHPLAQTMPYRPLMTRDTDVAKDCIVAGCDGVMIHTDRARYSAPDDLRRPLRGQWVSGLSESYRYMYSRVWVRNSSRGSAHRWKSCESFPTTPGERPCTSFMRFRSGLARRRSQRSTWLASVSPTSFGGDARSRRANDEDPTFERQRVS